MDIAEAGPYYLVLLSCKELHFFQVSPAVNGVNPYGYLSAEEFPLLPVYV